MGENGSHALRSSEIARIADMERIGKWKTVGTGGPCCRTDEARHNGRVMEGSCREIMMPLRQPSPSLSRLIGHVSAHMCPVHIRSTSCSVNGYSRDGGVDKSSSDADNANEEGGV